MTATSLKQNKAFVLKAFDTLFNKRDYVAAERFWSQTYIQRSAHIPPGCAVDCGTTINPDTVQAQLQSAVIFGITAALHGEITLRCEIRSAGRHGRVRDFGHRSSGDQCNLRGYGQAPANAADPRC